jgi:hypothetical protein
MIASLGILRIHFSLTSNLYYGQQHLIINYDRIANISIKCCSVDSCCYATGELKNGVIQLVSRQRIGKYVPKAMNTHTTVELLLETVFFTRCVQSGYKKDNWGVGGDENGGLKSERVKYGREYQGTRIRERLRWQGSAAKDRPVLSSERALHIKTRLWLSNSNKYLVMSLRWGSTPRLTD